MKDYYLWDKDAVLEVASIFDSMVEFRMAYHGAYKHASRHGYLDEVRAVVIPEVTDIDSLMRKLRMELDSSRRHFLTAIKTRAVGNFSVEDDSGEAPIGNYLDHDIGHWEQAAEEREDRALDWVEAICKHGTDDDIAAAWAMFADHQERGRLGIAPRRARRGINTQRQGGK